MVGTMGKNEGSGEAGDGGGELGRRLQGACPELQPLNRPI